MCEAERASAFRYLLELEEKKESPSICLPFQSSRWSRNLRHPIVHSPNAVQDIEVGVIRDGTDEDETKESEPKEEV